MDEIKLRCDKVTQVNKLWKRKSEAKPYVINLSRPLEGKIKM
jgi:hypothetical protein